MQLQVQRRAARSVGYSLAYTLSRTKDDGSTRLEILPNAYDDSGYYGISDIDRPHMLITQASYRTPALESAPAIAEGRARRLEPRRRVPGAVGCAVRRARPRWTSPASGPGSGAQYYNIVGDPKKGARNSTARAPSGSTKRAFQAPAAGAYATTWERNNLRQPGFWDLHMSLRKSVAVGTHRVELRWDVFNVLNHPTWEWPIESDFADFGTITSRTGNRTMQMGCTSSSWWRVDRGCSKGVSTLLTPFLSQGESPFSPEAL